MEEDSKSSQGGGRDVLIDLVAGSLGATASVVVGQPLDTLKVQLRSLTLGPSS